MRRPEPAPAVTSSNGRGPVEAPTDSVVVLDFGAQYAQLIARRVREAHVHSEILPYNTSAKRILQSRPKAIIFSGGPESVHAEKRLRVDRAIYEAGVPILGICYGAQLIAQDLGGLVKQNRNLKGEGGRTALRILNGSRLFQDEPSRLNVFMSHGDTIFKLPKGFKQTARTDAVEIAAFEDSDKRIFGLQFHPEVAHTESGTKVLKRFLYGAAGCQPTWTGQSIIERSIEKIRAQVGDATVLCGLSGGVDSAVAAALVDRAVGAKLTCVLVDTGLLREGEVDEVRKAFAPRHARFIVEDAKGEFLKALAGKTDPEEKRKAIGERFIRTFESVADSLPDTPRYLVQGTLYPDVVESGGGTNHVIKSHHNVGGLPQDMDFELVEPLKDLFKDEVREVGIELELPPELVWRHPFPGPGLAVRIVGPVNEENLAIVRAADAIVTEELRKLPTAEKKKIWQAFAVLLADVRSVGVFGDARTWEHPVVVRAVGSEDGMTAEWAEIPHRVMRAISTRITNEVRGVNRVVFDATDKPPGTIEWQ